MFNSEYFFLFALHVNNTMQNFDTLINLTLISRWYVVKYVSQKRNQSNNKNEWYNILVNLYLNSARVYISLIYVYSVISVNDKRLYRNTKKWTLACSWLIRVRLVEIHTRKMHMYFVTLVLYEITCITSNTDIQDTDSNVGSCLLI